MCLTRGWTTASCMSRRCSPWWAPSSGGCCGRCQAGGCRSRRRNMQQSTNIHLPAAAIRPHPLTPSSGRLHRGGKGTCFAYGQTGSGKTYTMGPLPLRAAADIFNVMSQPNFGGLCLNVRWVLAAGPWAGGQAQLGAAGQLFRQAHGCSQSGRPLVRCGRLRLRLAASRTCCACCDAAATRSTAARCSTCSTGARSWMCARTGASVCRWVLAGWLAAGALLPAA